MKTLIFIFWALTVNPETSHENYIKSNMLYAKICEFLYGIPASIQLSQAILESGGGMSYIAKNSNNHFGIRYYKEEFNGACFIDRAGGKWRAYPSVFIAYLDHARFMSEHYPNSVNRNYSYYKHLSGYSGSGYWLAVTNYVKTQNLNKYDY